MTREDEIRKLAEAKWLREYAAHLRMIDDTSGEAEHFDAIATLLAQPAKEEGERLRKKLSDVKSSLERSHFGSTPNLIRDRVRDAEAFLEEAIAILAAAPPCSCSRYRGALEAVRDRIDADRDGVDMASGAGFLLRRAYEIIDAALAPDDARDRAVQAEANMASDPEMEGHVEAPRDEKEE